MELIRLSTLAILLGVLPLCLHAQAPESEAYQQFKEALADPEASTPTLTDLLTAIEAEEETHMALVDWGNLVVRAGNVAKADSLFGRALPYLLQGQNHLYVLQAYNGKARALQVMGRFKEGITLAEEAQGYIDNHPQDLNSRALQQLTADVYRIIGIFYMIQLDSEVDKTAYRASGISYFRKAQRIYKAVEDYEMSGLTLFNLGTSQATEDSTIYYWEQAIEMFNNHGLQHKNMMVYQNMAILYIDQGLYQKSMKYLKLVEEIMPEPANPYDLSLYKIKLGKATLGLGQTRQAIGHLQEGLDIALANQMLSLEGEAYELLLQAYPLINQYKEAFEIYVRYDSLLAQYNAAETERIFRETEARYKTKEQAAEIQLLEQSEELNEAQIARQKLLIIIAVAVVLIIALVSYFLWKRGLERQQMNEQLKKLDQTRTRFLVNISHELRTPLTLVHAPLQDAMEQLKNGRIDRVENDLQKIRNNTNKLLQLTEEVLDISKLDEGALQLELSPTNLNQYLNLVFFSFESLALRQGLKWECQIEKTRQNHRVDQRKLEKVLNNLLSNAIKNTPKGGKVTLTASLAADVLQVSIADTGKGIPNAKLDRIFQRYYQADKADQKSGGLGIGLAFVKELLDFMQGSIQVQSVEGAGTTFNFQLPLSPTEEESTLQTGLEEADINIENRPAVHLGDQEKAHILVVEDNPEMSDFIQQLLSDNYRVTLADHGKDGLNRLHSGSYDLITADVMMPEMDGISFVKEVKGHSNWKNLPVVMITALSEEADKIEGLQLGIDDYIPKPFNANELKVRIDNLLTNAQVRKETQSEADGENLGNEEKLLTTARELVESRLSDNDFGVKDLATHLNLSERQANRVLKKMTGLSCLQFIREIKLQKANRFLELRQYATIAEIAYAVGFENTSYFTRIFTERFGKKPSEFLM